MRYSQRVRDLEVAGSAVDLSLCPRNQTRRAASMIETNSPGTGMMRWHSKPALLNSFFHSTALRSLPPVTASMFMSLINWCSKHGDVVVCATTACLRARLRTAPIRSRERQRADAQLLMTFCLAPDPHDRRHLAEQTRSPGGDPRPAEPTGSDRGFRLPRSEERRVGKECRSRWCAY